MPRKRKGALLVSDSAQIDTYARCYFATIINTDYILYDIVEISFLHNLSTFSPYFLDRQMKG